MGGAGFRRLNYIIIARRDSGGYGKMFGGASAAAVFSASNLCLG